MDLIDRFPLDASGGCDFLTGLGVREYVTVDDAGREVRRPERVLVLPRFFAYGDPPPGPGRCCITETTARAIGVAIGLVDRTAHAAALKALKTLRAEADELSLRVAQLENENEALRDSTMKRVVYVSPTDGTEHGSRAALDRHVQTAPQEVTA